MTKRVGFLFHKKLGAFLDAESVIADSTEADLSIFKRYILAKRYHRFSRTVFQRSISRKAKIIKFGHWRMAAF